MFDDDGDDADENDADDVDDDDADDDDDGAVVWCGDSERQVNVA